MITPGTIIDGRYEVISIIGVGGFGTIVEAHQLQLERLVAIKLLKTTLLSDPDGLPRFEREAKTINALKHKNIVSFYGYGAWQDAPYIVMEFIEGTSLDTIIEKGKLEHTRALKVIAQVFEALDFAHLNGVVHRDLKPSNIMIITDITGSEVVKIIDFGLAKLMPGYGIPGQKLTETGYALGSGHYMPPEQALGIPVDQRADIYSAGCILQQILTGTVPFDAPDNVAVMFQHINSPSPRIAQTLGTSVQTSALQVLIDNCLAKNADDRYPDGAGAARDAHLLAAGRYDSIVRLNAKSGGSGKSDRPGTTKVWIKAIVLTAVLTAGLSGAIYYDWVRQKGSSSKTAQDKHTSDFGKQLKSKYDDTYNLRDPLMPATSLNDRTPQDIEKILTAPEQDNHITDREAYDLAEKLSSYYYERSNFEKSEKYSRQALEQNSRLNKHWISGRLFENLARAQMRQQKSADAMITLEKGMAARNQFDSGSGGIASCHLCALLITVYIDEGELRKASQLADWLRTELTQAGLYKIDSLIALGNLELAKGNYGAAQENFKSAIEVNEKGEARGWLGLARSELYQRHFELAAKYASNALESNRKNKERPSFPITSSILILTTAAAQKKERASVEAFVQRVSTDSPMIILPRPTKLNERDISIALAELHAGGFDILMPRFEKAAKFNLLTQKIAPELNKL